MSDGTMRAAMAERAARAGGVVALEDFRTQQVVETKANKNDYVTESDRDAQRQVIATVRQEFPHATFVCEEASIPPGAEDAIELVPEVPDTGPAWIVDPIDGTSNFVRGIRFWATSVAAVVDGDPVGVATFMPAADDSFTAGPESVSLNDNSMTVSERTDPETFAIGLLGWWPETTTEDFGALTRALDGHFGDVRRLGCMQGVLALVASGALDGAVLPIRPHPWDSIAGVHLIRRAGGTVTDAAGEPWTNGSRALLASNGNAHDDLLEAVSESVGVEAAD